MTIKLPGCLEAVAPMGLIGSCTPDERDLPPTCIICGKENEDAVVCSACAVEFGTSYL